MLSAVKQLRSESAGELQPYLLLAIGARLMMTKNLWVLLMERWVHYVVLCLEAGAQRQLHELPACLLIELNQYSGPPFIPSCP